MEDPIICDNGTGFIKTGRCTSNYPEYSVPSVIGRPHPNFAELVDRTIDMSAEFIGEQIESRRAALKLIYPMEEGIVKDWDTMEKVWAYTFAKFHSDHSKTCLMMTEAPLNPKKNREKMAEIIFEKFGFLGLDVQIQATLSLYAMGYMTGLVIDSGDGVTHCIPVSEGVVLNHSIQRINVAGRHLTDYLIKLLLLRGYNFHTSSDFEVVREIKEKLCYVSADILKEREIAKETTILESDYQLPDGTWIKVGQERFECGEVLFSPYLLGKESDGLSQMVFNSIMASPMDVRASLYKGMLLSGGTTMLPGISTRIQRDMRKLHKELRGGSAASKIVIKVEDPPYRKHLVYIGATTLAKIYKSNPENTWIYKFNYEEEGPRILHKVR